MDSDPPDKISDARIYGLVHGFGVSGVVLRLDGPDGFDGRLGDVTRHAGRARDLDGLVCEAARSRARLVVVDAAECAEFIVR